MPFFVSDYKSDGFVFIRLRDTAVALRVGPERQTKHESQGVRFC